MFRFNWRLIIGTMFTKISTRSRVKIEAMIFINDFPTKQHASLQVLDLSIPFGHGPCHKKRYLSRVLLLNLSFKISKGCLTLQSGQQAPLETNEVYTLPPSFQLCQSRAWRVLSPA